MAKWVSLQDSCEDLPCNSARSCLGPLSKVKEEEPRIYFLDSLPLVRVKFSVSGVFPPFIYLSDTLVLRDSNNNNSQYLHSAFNTLYMHEFI